MLHRDGNLLRYLGKLLIKRYKKEDPHKQSVWNSDTPRMSFLIRVPVGIKQAGSRIKEEFI